MSPLLSIRNLTVEFESGKASTIAVNKVSFEVQRGEILAIVGESGSGKSVTALSILRLNPSPPAIYSSGEILFSASGNDPIDLLRCDNASLQRIRGNRIGMIFQEPMTSLNPVITCGKQVAESIRVHKKISAEKAKQEAIHWFERVKLPQPSVIYHRYPHELSGGQKQRVMIAMAMCCDPALLICDEPTTALDVTVQRTVLDLIRELQENTGMGVIFITHDLGVVGEIAHRALVMYRGNIVENGAVKKILKNPEHSYTKALIECRPVHHKRGERLPVVADFMSGEKIKHPPLAPLEHSDEILLEVKDLAVWFPAKRSLFGKPKEWIRAVDNVNLHVFRGETLGLVGESGCGKTTLGRAIMKLIEPTTGKIIYDGRDMSDIRGKELQSLRRDVQIVFQDPYSSLNPRMTIGDAIAEPLKVHHITSERQRKERVRELLQKVDLDAAHYNRYPHEFSGGQRQRIVIARALALDPGFIVCDESVSALDVSVQAQVLNLLNDLKREFGFTVIFISHDLSVVRYISDRMIVMQSGKIVESGPSDEIYTRPRTAYTQKLIASIPKGIPA